MASKHAAHKTQYASAQHHQTKSTLQAHYTNAAIINFIAPPTTISMQKPISIICACMHIPIKGALLAISSRKTLTKTKVINLVFSLIWIRKQIKTKTPSLFCSRHPSTTYVCPEWRRGYSLYLPFILFIKHHSYIYSKRTMLVLNKRHEKGIGTLTKETVSFYNLIRLII